MSWITPCHRREDFPAEFSTDDKITIFCEQTLGWQLDIADACINGGLEVMRHSGYAVLLIVLSYFEMIAEMKGLSPFGGKGSQGKFNAGVLDVFRELSSSGPDVRDNVLKILYVSGRCGLYHEGRVRGRIIISGDFQGPLVYEPHNRILGINPHKLVPKLKAHLEEYILALKGPDGTDLRKCFEQNFNRMSGTDPLVSTVPKTPP